MFGNWIDCRTVGFFLKISTEIGKAWRKSVMRTKPEPCVWGERKKNVFLASLPSFALTFPPRSRPYVWRKNTDCFAVQEFKYSPLVSFAAARMGVTWCSPSQVTSSPLGRARLCRRLSRRVDRFYSRGQQLGKCNGTEETAYIIKRFNSYVSLRDWFRSFRTPTLTLPPSYCFGIQYGGRDVM